jgi:uncharacterized membrane protein
MKTKTLNLMFAGVFALVFLIGFASATITLTPSLTTLTQTSGSFNLTVSSNQNETVDLAIPSVSDGSGHNVVFSLSPSAQVQIDTLTQPSRVVTVTYAIDSGFNFEFTKTYNANLTAVGTVSGQTSRLLSFTTSDFCEYSNVAGQLSTAIKTVKVTEGAGEKKEWFAFDTVEVTVKVENTGDEDLNDVSVEWGLYDAQSKDWTISVDETDNFNLNSGDDQTVTVTFTLNDNMDENLQDLEKGDYIFYVRATGDIDAGTHEGDNACSSDSETGTLKLDKDFVILKNLEIPEVVQCDSEFHISGDAWNIGSKDQSDVYALVYNKELGINNQKVIIGDIDSFDSSSFDFSFTIPENIAEKKYPITITLYDNNDDVYQNANNDESISTIQLNVQGGCAAKASVNAVLESGGQAGKSLVVKATITNTGNKVGSYSLNAAGYTGWASSATLDKSSLVLNAGESGEVLLTFNVNKDALGTNLFNLEVLSNDKLIVNQPVQVEITKKKWGITGNLFSGDNKYIWGIGLLNLILIVLIIVIAIRIARK